MEEMRGCDSSADGLLPFVQEAVAPGAVVIADGLQSYCGLSRSRVNIWIKLYWKVYR